MLHILYLMIFFAYFYLLKIYVFDFWHWLGRSFKKSKNICLIWNNCSLGEKYIYKQVITIKSGPSCFKCNPSFSP